MFPDILLNTSQGAHFSNNMRVQCPGQRVSLFPARRRGLWAGFQAHVRTSANTTQLTLFIRAGCSQPHGADSAARRLNAEQLKNKHGANQKKENNNHFKSTDIYQSSQYFQTEVSYSGSALKPAYLGSGDPPPPPHRPTERVTEKNSNNAAAPVQKNVIRVYPFWPWQVQPTKRAAHKVKSLSAVTLIKGTACIVGTIELP